MLLREVGSCPQCGGRTPILVRTSTGEWGFSCPHCGCTASRRLVRDRATRRPRLTKAGDPVDRESRRHGEGAYGVRLPNGALRYGTVRGALDDQSATSFVWLTRWEDGGLVYIVGSPNDVNDALDIEGYLAPGGEPLAGENVLSDEE